MVSLVDSLPVITLDRIHLVPGIQVIQDIVTPEDTSKKELIPDDLPYAGYLSVRFSLFEWHNFTLKQYYWSIGMVGPASGGEQMQKSFHALIGNNEPKGWKHQLDNQLMLGLGYVLGYRTWQRVTKNGRRANWFNTMSIDLGNFYTGAMFGTLFQFGANYPDNMVTFSNLAYGNNQARFSFESDSNPTGWSIIAGFYLNTVAHIYLIDNAPDHDLDRGTLAGKGIISFNLHSDRYQISFMLQAARRNVNQSEMIDHWGRITISWI